MLKDTHTTEPNQWPGLILSFFTGRLLSDVVLVLAHCLSRHL